MENITNANNVLIDNNIAKWELVIDYLKKHKGKKFTSKQLMNKLKTTNLQAPLMSLIKHEMIKKEMNIERKIVYYAIDYTDDI